MCVCVRVCFLSNAFVDCVKQTLFKAAFWSCRSSEREEQRDRELADSDKAKGTRRVTGQDTQPRKTCDHRYTHLLPASQQTARFPAEQANDETQS